MKPSKILDRQQMKEIFDRLTNNFQKNEQQDENDQCNEHPAQYMKFQQKGYTFKDEIEPINYFDENDQKQLKTTIQQQNSNDNSLLNMTNQNTNKKENNSQTCNCKNQQCNKKYCDCFVNGRKCNENCKCTDCLNVNSDVELVERKKVKSCNCKKSKCKKNYCECYNQGLFCNQSCQCIDCLNKEIIQHNDSSFQDSPIATH